MTLKEITLFGLDPTWETQSKLARAVKLFQMPCTASNVTSTSPFYTFYKSGLSAQSICIVKLLNCPHSGGYWKKNNILKRL